MRLGTTSYIYPADILTNVRKLAGVVQDVELLIFEAGEHGNNYPERKVLQELRRIAAASDLTFTVHLPLDLDLAADRPALATALGVVRHTTELAPHGFVVHLDGNVRDQTLDRSRWLENSVRSLEALLQEVPDPRKICVENLESQPPELLDAVLALLPVSCCVDVGHLWKQGLDPVPLLDAWLPRAGVVHLHGLGKRDHERLSLMDPAELDPVVAVLARDFDGVVTFEIFSEADLLDCLEAFKRARERLGSGEDFLP
ncbi:MAG: sugar phosphate isomerase/epimerase [Desulfomonile tiedjei]|nr:sugar phosphate isomerase/epimerase [Desulfomonile tiedjei]